MSVTDSIYVAFFLMAIVFIALICLYVSLRLFSFVFVKIENARKNRTAQKKPR